MDIRNTIRTSLITMIQKKLRTILTMLGIIIGISSVIIVTSIGKGQILVLENSVKNIINNKFILMYGNSSESNIYKVTDETYLTEHEINSISKNPNFEGVSPWITLNGDVKIITSNGIIDDSNLVNLEFFGIGTSFLKIWTRPLLYGRNFTENCNKNYIIIDNNLSKRLFGKINSVGNEITLKYNVKYYNFVIIGVVNNTRYQADKLENSNYIRYMLYIPARYALNISGKKYINLCVGRFNDNINYQTGCQLLRNELARLKKAPEDVFRIGNFSTTTADAMVSLKQLNNYVYLVATIALLVGGVVVMNIMLVTVSERISEIGLRKALGAKNRDILLQFLMEAVILTFSGGIIGIIVGLIGCFITDKINLIPPIVNWDIVALAVLVSVFIGIIFGVYPAYKAAKLNSIDALREEE